MSNNSFQNQRKRSRWGGSNTSNSNKTSSVSDQEALEALVASASSKQQQPQQQQHRNHHNNNTNKRPRRPDHQSGSGDSRRNRDSESGHDYSYYGGNRGDDDKDEKRRYKSSSSRVVVGDTDKDDYQDKEEGQSDEADDAVEKEKPNFGLSGALAQEQQQQVMGGKGGGDETTTDLLKFREPPEARAPNTQWRLYVFKGEEALETLHISKQSAYLLGRNQDLVDIPLLHPSSSGQHAVLQYRAVAVNNNNNKDVKGASSGAGNPGPRPGPQLRVKPYLMDLESTNGSFINSVPLDPRRYYELRKGDVLKFGASTREYVLLTENTTSIK